MVVRVIPVAKGRVRGEDRAVKYHPMKQQETKYPLLISIQ